MVCCLGQPTWQSAPYFRRLAIIVCPRESFRSRHMQHFTRNSLDLILGMLKGTSSSLEPWNLGGQHQHYALKRLWWSRGLLEMSTNHCRKIQCAGAMMSIKIPTIMAPQFSGAMALVETYVRHAPVQHICQKTKVSGECGVSVDVQHLKVMIR